MIELVGDSGRRDGAPLTGPEVKSLRTQFALTDGARLLILVGLDGGVKRRAPLDTDLRRRDTSEVHLDVAVRGVGTGSCGPDTRPEHRVAPGTYRWRWWLVVDEAGSGQAGAST